MDDTSLNLLEELTQAHGISGHETEVRNIFTSRLHGVGTISSDRLGSVFCTKKGDSANPRILLDSHLDEIGFVVQRVTDSGYVKFLPVGGWWAHTLLAQRVEIVTRIGNVPGVIGSIPPHLLGAGARERVMEIENLFIDIGAESRNQTMDVYGVQPGCAIVPYGPFVSMKNPKLFVSKAFDNRLGVALVIETLQKLNGHANTVIGSGSVQEELGLRGARTVANIVQPDVAIVLEAPPADDAPGTEIEARQGQLGGGVQIRLYDPTMIPNPRLCELVVEIAREEQIPHQLAVRYSGGTNAGAIHQAGRGVPSIVLGVPARYIHSHLSIINIDDYAAALELVMHLLPKLDQATVDALV